VLPSRFPNLLANGAAGIAVGMATSIPPHNVGELCDALGHLIENPKCEPLELVEFVKGPDFPTGGVLVETAEGIRQAYATGRGSFRLRARWRKDVLSHGLYQVVITEIPYQVKKSSLIEKIAALLEEKKLPLLADIRDESAEEVRIVLEPKSRNVVPEVLMESLFRATELETRVPLNMNVLDAAGVPRVMNLKDVLKAFLDHRREVLQRRTEFRLAEIARRVEILKGQMIVYLNLDEVIRIIREEDDPKAKMQKRWKLTDVQCEAILNLRLRALRKLEEIAIKKELKDLHSEEEDLRGLLDSSRRQWRAIGKEIAATRKEFDGTRRTEIGEPPAAVMVPVEALVERENVTVVCSEKGWIRTVKGHNVAPDELKYKEGDAGRFLLAVETTDKLAVFASNGRFYTLPIDKLPGGRGHGEPLRLMIDLPNEHDVVALFAWRPSGKLLLASTDGRGFITPTDDILAQTRAGKQVMTPAEGARANICIPVQGDAVALLAENRKMLVVKLEELPEMARGRGVTLQKFKDGTLIDAKMVTIAEGLLVRQGEVRTRLEADLTPWLGARASTGRMAPKELVRSGRF
jgi:topoisomerase-4 subunit A